jgi:hypothetical protein
VTRRHALLSALAYLAAPAFPEPPAPRETLSVLTRDGWARGYVNGAGMLVVLG